MSTVGSTQSSWRRQVTTDTIYYTNCAVYSLPCQTDSPALSTTGFPAWRHCDVTESPGSPCTSIMADVDCNGCRSEGENEELERETRCNDNNNNKDNDDTVRSTTTNAPRMTSEKPQLQHICELQQVSAAVTEVSLSPRVHCSCYRKGGRVTELRCTSVGLSVRRFQPISPAERNICSNFRGWWKYRPLTEHSTSADCSEIHLL